MTKENVTCFLIGTRIFSKLRFPIHAIIFLSACEYLVSIDYVGMVLCGLIASLVEAIRTYIQTIQQLSLCLWK